MTLPLFIERSFIMLGHKEVNYIKKLIVKVVREEIVKQLNKSAFKTAYKPTDENSTDDNGGVS